MNRTELFRIANDLTERGEPFVFAVVVRRLGSHSSVVGDSAVVTADGDFHGWVGGSCVQPEVVRWAQKVLARREPMTLAFSPDHSSDTRPQVTPVPMTCHSGASVDIFMEPVMPPLRLTLFGDSPVIHTLARLGAALDLAVEVVPPSDAPQPTGGPAGGGGHYAVVATMGENDEGALKAALGLGADYLGVVASSKRFAGLREFALSQGADEAALDRVSNPAGLDIGARRPDEIAVAILAEIVERHAAARAEDAAAAEAGPAAAREETAEEAPAEAIDPICGMTVQVAGAKHVATWQGESYYFCCGGCRERFLAAPEEYVGDTGGEAAG